MESLQQLRALVFNGGFDKDSRKLVESLELRLREVTVKERLKEKVGVKDWYEYLRTEWNRCHTALATMRNLTELEREKLWVTKEVCERFLNIFDTDEVKKRIDDEVQKALNRAHA